MKKDFLSGLDECIENGLKKLNVPGVTVAVTKGDKLLFSRAYGYADLEKQIKMETTHVLPIGSSSKSFTAAAAVMLVAEGKLDLDQPIRKYMPEFDLADPIAAKEATPRDLLCHRTGLPRHEFMWVDWDDITRKEIVEKRLKHLTPNKPFRSVWQYQNHMFATVGYLVEKVSGKTWESFVEKRIFKPLGMPCYGFLADYESKTVEFARLYTEDDNHVNRENPPLRIDAMGPAGSIHSTAEQMTKYVRFMLNKGKAGKKTLIDEKLFSELTTPNIHYQLLPFDIPGRMPVGYALGWFVDNYRGHRVVDHGGNVNGATALVSMLPDDDIGLVILVNADSSMFCEALSMEIYDRYLDISDKHDWFEIYNSNFQALITDMKKKTNELYESKKEGKPASHDLSEYAGTYAHPGYGEFTVSCEDNSLSAAYHGVSHKLAHLHYDIFTFELMKVPFPVSFATGAKGDIESLSVPFEGTQPPILFEKKKEG